jgi:hypothetical protein
MIPLGLESAEFWVKNSSKDETLLLYRIHRSEPKLVSFNPKKGIVEPGHQTGISLKFIDPKITLARVLVKVVEIHRSKLGTSFSASWNIGMKTIVKKVVEIRNATYCLSSESKDSMSYTNESFRTLSDREYDPIYQLSARSSTSSNFTFSPRNSYAAVSSTNPGVASPINRSLISQKPQDCQKAASKALLSKQPSAMPTSDTDSIESDVLKLKEAYAQESDIASVLDTIFKTIHKEPCDPSISGEAAKSLLIGLGIGLGAATKPSRTSTSDTTTISSNRKVNEDKPPSPTSEDPAIDSLNTSASKSKGELVTKEYYDVKHCSSLNVLSASDEVVSLLLLIQGQYVDNDLVAESMKHRITESIRADQRISALEVSNAPMVNSVSESVAKLFDSSHDSGHRNRDLVAMQGAILRDHLRHLTITSTKITAIEISLNHFVSLSHVDLSSNAIKAIAGPLHLPKLSYLNLSHNQLSSLDYLQELISLKTLIVSSNLLTSFKSAINVLVPLAGSLQVLDMSFNPICSNLRYAEHVLSVLPYLKYFDAKDLDRLREMITPKAFDMSLSKSPPIASSFPARAPKSQSKNYQQENEDEFTQRLKRAIKRQHQQQGFNSPTNGATAHRLRAPSAPTATKQSARYQHANTSMDSSDTRSRQGKIVQNISADSSILELTDSLRMRRRYFGMPTDHHHHHGDELAASMLDESLSSIHTSSHKSSSDPFTRLYNRGRSKSTSKMTPETFRQMQEDEKYSIYKSRFVDLSDFTVTISWLLL